jgi:hypothetical protein
VLPLEVNTPAVGTGTGTFCILTTVLAAGEPVTSPASRIPLVEDQDRSPALNVSTPGVGTGTTTLRILATVFAM